MAKSKPKTDTQPSTAALKGQITKLSNKVEVLEAEAQAALDAQKAAEEALTTAQAQRDETHQALQDAQLQIRALTEAAATPAKPQTTEEVFGTVRAGGLLVMAAADLLDTQWSKPGEARSQFAVDFTGPSAEFLATRNTRATKQQLADGTWRVLVDDAHTARTVVGGAKKYMTEHPDGTTVHSAPVHCSSMLALDATRAQGFGLVTVAGQPAMLALRGSDSMKMSVVKDAEGRVIGVKVTP